MTDHLELPAMDAVDALAPEVLPSALAHLLALQARVVARLTEAAPGSARATSGDRMLTIDEAADRTGMSKDWLYRHADTLPFARRIGRARRFSEAALTRWLATRAR